MFNLWINPYRDKHLLVVSDMHCHQTDDKHVVWE